MKPKVRARLTSLRNEVVEKSIEARCERRLKIGWLNSISKFTLKPSNGSNCAHLSPSSTRSRFFTRMKRFGWCCSSMPADCSRNTNGPALPSDRKSTRLNSSHLEISYAVFCLKKKTMEMKSGEKASLEMKSGEKASLEMKNGEKASLEMKSGEKASLEMKSDDNLCWEIVKES